MTAARFTIVMLVGLFLLAGAALLGGIVLAYQAKSIPDPLWLIATGVVTGIIGWIAPQPGQQRVTIDQPANDPIPVSESVRPPDAPAGA